VQQQAAVQLPAEQPTQSKHPLPTVEPKVPTA